MQPVMSSHFCQAEILARMALFSYFLYKQQLLYFFVWFLVLNLETAHIRNNCVAAALAMLDQLFTRCF